MRAWNCHGRTHREMVERLCQAGIVRSEAVKAVLTATDRQYYVPATVGGTGSSAIPLWYQDAPVAIGLGQTISAPHMHAHVLEEILPYVQINNNKQDGVEAKREMSEPIKLLDVGCGSGYLTACFGRWLKAVDDGGETTDSTRNSSILGRQGTVYGIDIHDYLVDLTRSNMERGTDGDLLTNGVVQLSTGNGWLGLPDAAPFDAIHVGAAAAALPVHLATQLKVGGVLIVPIGPVQGAQILYKIERLRRGSRQTAESANDKYTSSALVQIGTTDSGNILDNVKALYETSETFDVSDYHVKELLGVRYVPLIEQPTITE